MYKFTNGVVCYDEETKNKYLSAGMSLVKEEPEKKEEKQIGESKIANDIKRNEFGRNKKRTDKFGKNYR